MARITVEDCLGQIHNRFELVLAASKRARQLEIGGAEATLPWENDKPTVMALREIAEGETSFEPPKQELIVDIATPEEEEGSGAH